MFNTYKADTKLAYNSYITHYKVKIVLTMKPLSFKVPKGQYQTIRVQVDHQSYFYDSFHYHPEIQIVYILDGTGTRIIGDSIGRFNEDEIYVIGSNTPHIFKSDKTYYKKDAPFSHAISFYFTEDSFGEKFFKLPETQELDGLLKDSKRTIYYQGESIIPLKKMFLDVTSSTGFEKIRMFFDILHNISKIKNRKLLSKSNVENSNLEKHGKRINDIVDFVIHNYDKQISVEKAAEITNLSATSFCRFFKERTRKSFVEFVNEVRIGEACKLLMSNEFNISQICYEVGFNNISNFNRKFKEIIKITPKEYRQTFS